jgi:hypothetical protein
MDNLRAEVLKAFPDASEEDIRRGVSLLLSRDMRTIARLPRRPRKSTT